MPCAGSDEHATRPPGKGITNLAGTGKALRARHTVPPEEDGESGQRDAGDEPGPDLPGSIFIASKRRCPKKLMRKSGIMYPASEPEKWVQKRTLETPKNACRNGGIQKTRRSRKTVVHARRSRAPSYFAKRAGTRVEFRSRATIARTRTPPCSPPSSPPSIARRRSARTRSRVRRGRTPSLVPRTAAASRRR